MPADIRHIYKSKTGIDLAAPLINVTPTATAPAPLPATWRGKYALKFDKQAAIPKPNFPMQARHQIPPKSVASKPIWLPSLHKQPAAPKLISNLPFIPLAAYLPFSSYLAGLPTPILNHELWELSKQTGIQYAPSFINISSNPAPDFNMSSYFAPDCNISISSAPEVRMVDGVEDEQDRN